jgi:hypothetical protein
VIGSDDAYAIWGDWDLQRFKIEVARWRDTDPHPPADLFDHVNGWWSRLKQPLEWRSAARVPRDADPQGSLRWLWVPDAAWVDDNHGYYRVQCYFRVYEAERPPRLVCQEFRSVPAMKPDEIDQADGMG